MKFSATFLALFVAGAHGFAPAGPAFMSQRLSMSSTVAEPDAAVEEKIVEAPDAPPAALSGLRMKDVRKAVAQLDADNFSKTLEDIEPFLLNEAGASLYAKSMRRIKVQAAALGVEVPASYGKAAKANKKRQEKQDAFIAMKEEERLAAEAEAAEAAAEAEAAEAETSEEEVAPTEE